MWGVLERDVIRGPHNNMASLKHGIVWIMESLESAPLVRACKRFWTRLEKVVAAEGDFIE